MTVKTGRFVVRRDGVEVDASGDWRLGPAVSSSDVAGVDATMTWHRTEPVSVLEKDYNDEEFLGADVTIDWVDEEGETRVFTGTVAETSGGSMEEPVSRLTDRTERLTRSLDLRPMAYTLPVHPINAGQGSRLRHVGLFGVWFTHQAMVHSGFDPGVPMHWSAVWYQSMCGSVATVPDRTHAFASLGDLRQAYRLSNADLAPGFPQGENQVVAEDVFSFGVTSPPRPNTESLPWQLTWDLPIDGGDEGEIVLRHLNTKAGLAVRWTADMMRFYRHNPDSSQVLLGSVGRHRDPETGDKRWSVVISPSGSNVIVRTDARGEVARYSNLGTALPTGRNGLCTVRTSVPGKIGPIAVTRGDRHYMTTEPPKGRILRDDMRQTSLPGWPNMPGLEAGRILADQADAHRGLRGQPLWQWIDEHGLLINTDFDTLARRPVTREFDTRPDSGDLALDKLSWSTDPTGGPWSAVEVTAKRQSVARRDRPSLLLAEGSAQSLQHGDSYEVFLRPESGTTWLEPDLRPLMAGWPYPSPPYHPGYKNYLNGEIKTWLGGHRFFADGGERRGWLHPYQMGWTVDSLGHVQDAMTLLDPETVLVKGEANLPQGKWPQDASTSPDPGSQGLGARRKDQPFPQLRGYGLMVEVDASVTLPITGIDDRHPAYAHDCGLWIQSNSGMTRIGEYLHQNIVRPTPMRTAQVEATGWVKAGDKVLLRERRRNGIVIEEQIVVTPIEGSTHPSDDSMTITGVVTSRRVVQTDPSAPPVDEEEEWVTQPPEIIPEPPRSTEPPIREDDPPPEDQPGPPPVKPSDPTLAFDAHGVLVVTWDGQTVAGDSAVTISFGSAEVALEKEPVPSEVVGQMWTLDDGTFEYQEPSIDYGSQWWARIRTVDRWGRVSEWSEVAGPVEVRPLVDPEQFEDLRDLLNEAADWIAESGAGLDVRLTQAQEDLDAAEGRLEDAEAGLVAAQAQIDAAQGWITESGAELDTRLGAAETSLGDAQDRLDAAETTINTTFPTQIAGLADDVIGIHQEIAAIQTATGQRIVTSPTPPNPAETDLWIDTSGTPAVPKFHNGTEWEPLSDPDAIAAALAAAKDHADALPKVLHGTSVAAGAAPNGSVWFQHAGTISGPVIAQWTRVGGSWQSTPIDSRAIANLDVGKLTAGSADIHTLVAQKIAGASAEFIDLDVKNLISTNATINEGVINQLWTDVVRSKKITTDMLVVGPGENMWPDPWFQDEDGWTTGNTSVGTDATAPGGRKYTIQSSSASQTGGYYRSVSYRGIKLNPGGTYKFRFSARRGGNVPHPADLRLFFRGEDAGGVTRSWGQEIPAPTNHTYTYYEAAVTVPEALVGGCTMGIYRNGSFENSSVLIADVSMVSMTDASLVVDGTIAARHINTESIAAEVASIMQLDVENLVATGTSTLREAVVEKLWVDVVRSKKITTDMLLVGQGENLIRDPYLQDPEVNSQRTLGAGWTIHNAPTLGNMLRQGTWTNGATELNGTEWIPVAPGQEFQLTWEQGGGSQHNIASLRPTIRYRYMDNSLTYTTWPGSSNHTYSGPGYERQTETITIPANVKEVRVLLRANSAGSGVVYVKNPHFGRNIGSLIVDGTIKARHLDAESVAAEIGEFVEIEANQITTGSLNATVTVSGRIQTAVAGQRAIMDATGIRYVNGAGSPLFSADSSGVYVAGDLRTDGPNGIQIVTDGSKYGNGIVRFRHSAYTLANSPYLALEYNPTGGTIATTVLSGSRNSSGKRAYVSLARDGLHARIQGGNAIFLDSDELTAEGVYRTTTTGTSNVQVNLLGSLRRTTSLASAKAGIEPLSDWQGVKALEPVTYYDRANLERLSAALTAGEDDEAVEHLTKWIGLTAEQAQKSGSGLETYDHEGNLNGVAYERLAVALLPWLHELETRITALEENP